MIKILAFSLKRLLNGYTYCKLFTHTDHFLYIDIGISRITMCEVLSDVHVYNKFDLLPDTGKSIASE